MRVVSYHPGNLTAAQGCIGLWWFWIFLIASLSPAISFGTEFHIRTWHIEDGLPDATVTALAQTPEGYLWVGTAQGLVRFDGSQFKTFEAGSSSGLSEAHIAALLVDQRGVLWVGGIRGSLAFYQKGHFETVCGPGATTSANYGHDADIDAGRAARWMWGRVSEMVQDRDGAVWLVCPKRGLLCWREGTVKIYTQQEGLPPGELEALCTDRSGNVWLGCGNSLYRRKNKAWELLKDPAVCAPLLRLTSSRSGGIWVASPNESWITGGGTIRRFVTNGWAGGLRPTPWTPNSLRSQITSLLEDQVGRVWIGTLWGGVYCSDADGKWQPITTHGAFAQCAITCLYQDREGAVWAGTVGEGLHRITERPVTMLELPAPARENIITASAAASDGSIWVGTDGAGAFRYDHEGFVRFSSKEGLTNQHVCALLEDGQTNLWAGTWGGLFAFKQGRFEKVRALPQLDLPVLALFEDRTGSLWIGTPDGPVYRRDGEFKLHSLDPLVGALDIRSFAQDAAGGLWVGTIGQGLFRLAGSEVRRFGPAEGFVSPNARSLLVDEAGTLWVGSDGAGLFRFANEGFQRFTSADGLPSDTISSLTPDGSGHLWMGSDNGIFVCSLDSLKSYSRGGRPALLGRRLGLEEGLFSRGCSGSGQPVTSRSCDGRMWFPNMRGLAVFHPLEIRREAQQRTLLVESVVVDGVELPSEPGRVLRVPSTARRFEFHYTAPDLSTAQSLRFRHRLEGMDQEWVEPGAERVAYYSQLPAGPYQLRTIVGGPEGSWYESQAPLVLYIVPRWWELRWVQVSSGIALAAGVAGLLVLSERRRLQRRLQLLELQQALEGERRRIARDLHDDLGSRLTEIVLLGELAKRGDQSPGVLQGQLTSLTRKARELVTAMQEVVWTINPKNDSLGSLANYLCDHTERFLGSVQISCRLDVAETLPDLPLTANVRHNLLLASKEALNNAVRHTGATKVRLRIWLAESRLHVAVEDDGCGFDPGKPARQGDGLSNMRSRMDSVGGDVAITSERGKGTTVIFVVPVE